MIMTPPPPLVQPLPWIHEYFEAIEAFTFMLHAFGISNLKKKTMLHAFPVTMISSAEFTGVYIFHSVVFFNNFVYEFSFLFFAVYITKQCGKSVNISEQNFVELSPATRPRITNTTCRLNLAPFSPNSNESGLVLTIEHIGLSSKTSGACLNNRINIYDGTEKLSKLINYFSITPPPPIINVTILLRNCFFFGVCVPNTR